MKWRCSFLFFVLLNQLRSAQTFFKTLPVTFSLIVSIFNVKTDNGEIKSSIFDANMNFPHRSRHIVHNLCSQSFLRRSRSRRENLQQEEHVWVKPGRGIIAQERALTFETPFFDGAQGIIAMILALAGRYHTVLSTSN